MTIAAFIAALVATVSFGEIIKDPSTTFWGWGVGLGFLFFVVFGVWALAS